MLRLPHVACVLAAAAVCASATAAPGHWRFDETVSGGGSRQARRIASPAADAINVLSPDSTTSTTPAPPVTKRLVTLAPGGNSIQDILFNNGYRETQADSEPAPNNIDDATNLDGLDRSGVWLLDGSLLVLKGGAFSDDFSDTEPLDDFQAPYRQPKFPPPEFLGEDELPPDLLTAWQFGFPGPAEPGSGSPVGPEGTVGYSPYGRPESRPELVAGPHSNVGAKPYARGQSYTAGQPHTDAQPYVDGEFYTGAQPYVQPYAGIRPYTDGQPYDEIRPYTGDKPEPYEGDKSYDRADQPHEGDKPHNRAEKTVNPELTKGYSPLGRPEPRPDSLYQTPRTGILLESETESSVPQSLQSHSGQSHGSRLTTDAGRTARLPAGVPSARLQPTPAAPGRTGSPPTHTFSVRTSYSSTSTQSSTSVRGHNARYLPPPRAQRPPNPR